METGERISFLSVRGMIVKMTPVEIGVGRAEGCIHCVSVRDESGNTVNFMLSPETFVVDWETLAVGAECTFWYRADEPAPLICPPRYNAAVAERVREDLRVDVSFYDGELVNEDHSLQLNLDESVRLRTTNNQIFTGSVGEHDLVVLYGNSTRSIPAQTTPKTVVVLCGNSLE